MITDNSVTKHISFLIVSCEFTLEDTPGRPDSITSKVFATGMAVHRLAVQSSASADSGQLPCVPEPGALSAAYREAAGGPGSVPSPSGGQTGGPS